MDFNSDLEDEITSDLGRKHFGPGSKSLRAWDEIGRGRNLEDEITSDLGRNYLGPRSPIRIPDVEDEIALQSGLPG